eukprot:TRINITY_DN32034_c0_g1_i1.p2 TRINITY_DN32034_c0_g1~~TRINITY_DN32034_c0_g1_i1.p2  ORF type:complete len:191 (+),score=116.52 TRINITY_DN32034_c0_g1_i1:56-628(+)
MPGAKKRMLVRDLHSMTDDIDLKIDLASKHLADVKGLKKKVNDVAERIQAADKDKSERMGKVEKEIAAHELKTIEVALLKNHQLPVDAFEMKSLRKLQKESEEQNAQKKQKLNSEVAEKVAQRVRFTELQFQEKYADLEAKEKAFQAERKTLNETIEALRTEIESQKRLTGDIAKAVAAPPPIQVVKGAN